MEFCFKDGSIPIYVGTWQQSGGGGLPPLMCECGRATTGARAQVRLHACYPPDRGSLFSEGGGVGQDTLQLHGGHMLIRSRDLVKEGEAWFLWLSSCGWGGSIGHEHHGMDLSIPPWTPHILQLG